MPNQLNVPWDKIQQSCEKGVAMPELAKLFGISVGTIRVRAARHNWNTPYRAKKKLEKADTLETPHGDRVTRVQGIRAQLEDHDGVRERMGESATALAKSTATLLQKGATSVDFEAFARDYRAASAAKLFRILSQTVIAPPRSWKDFDIADKMMRRTLGMDDGEGKANTVVQLQVVNERLRQTTTTDDILEGEMEVESVPETSPVSASPGESTD